MGEISTVYNLLSSLDKHNCIKADGLTAFERKVLDSRKDVVLDVGIYRKNYYIDK